MTDLEELHERRSREKKAMKQGKSKIKEVLQKAKPEQTEDSADVDEETLRVLRFLY